jgi:integrase
VVEKWWKFSGAKGEDMAYTWFPTGTKNLRYAEHPTRKNGRVKKDVLYGYRFRLGGELYEENLGWATDGWTLEKAQEALIQIKKAARTGKGPSRLKEQRQQAKIEKAKQEKEEARRERESVTLAEYWPEYLATAQGKKGETSWKKEITHFEKWLNPNLGTMPLKEIRVEHWDELLTTMKRAGLSPRTRQYVCLTLRQVMSHAFMRKVISEAPPAGKIIGATLPPDSNRRTRVLTSEELRKIMAEMKKRDIHGYRFILFLALTGGRVSDVYRLNWENVNIAGGEVTFQKTKNRKPRTIPISAPLIELLREIGPGQTGEPVFKMKAGGRYSEAPSSFRSIVSKLGLNKDRGRYDKITPHSLRHTAATMLAESHIPLRDMMSVMGWKTPSMALRYQHERDETKKRAMGTLEGMMQPDAPKVIPFPKSSNE